MPDPIAEYLAGACRHLSFPSLSLGVVRRGEPPRVFAAPAGAAEPRGYKAGSLTKLVTALAVLALEEDGRLRLGDPVSRHLGWFRAPGRGARPATLLDLMRHSAGLPRGGLLLSNPTAPEVEAIVGRAEPAPSLSAGAHYSNLGYVVLGLVVEAVAGEPFASFAARRILGPLGMRDSGFGAAGAALTPPNCLACFRPESTSPCDHRPMPLLSAPHASHDLTSTAADYAALLSRLMEGDPSSAGAAVGARSVATLLGAAWPARGRIRTGPGFRYAEGRHGGVFFENGEHFGHSASMLLVPSRGLALVAMANRGSAGLDLAHLLNTLAAYHLDGMDPARLNHDYPGAAALAGEYRSSRGSALALTVRGGALHASADGEPPAPLVYKGQHCFVKTAGRHARYGIRLDPPAGPRPGLCVGPHYFSRGGGPGVAAEAPRPALEGVYESAAAGRVALFGRGGKLVLAFAPFKEAELAEGGPGELVQATGPFRGERIHVCPGGSTLRIGTLAFRRIAESY